MKRVQLSVIAVALLSACTTDQLIGPRTERVHPGVQGLLVGSDIAIADLESIEIVKGAASAAIYGQHVCSAVIVVVANGKPASP